MSIFSDIGSALGKVAPWIVKALPLPPPLGSMAASAIGAVLGTDKTDSTSLSEAIAGATPEQLLALKEADQQFQLQMQKLGFENIEALERIAEQDRDSARNRQIQLKDRTPQILAYGYAVGFFMTLGVIIWMAVQHVIVDASIKTSLDMLLGVEVGMILGSKEYFFGSSSGSRAKDETIHGLSQ